MSHDHDGSGQPPKVSFRSPEQLLSPPRQVGPWQVVAEQRVYANPWIDVVHHRVLTPAGTAGIYGQVKFHHLAVAVLPLADNGDTWLVGQHRFPFDSWSWELPEGGCARGEMAEAAARRELREETGLEAETLTPLFEVALSNSVTDERAVAFLARGITLGTASPEPTEQLTVRRLPFAEAVAMVRDGVITDVMSVTTILRVQLDLLTGALATQG